MIGELFAVWCDLCYNQRKRRESASVRPYRNRGVASLFASKESRFAYISTSGKFDIIHERPTNVCILPGFWTCGVFYNTLSVIKIKC